MTNPVTNKTDMELVDYAMDQPSAVQAEFMRRQTIILKKSADAQERVTSAMIETAKYTRLNARYMLLSVVVLATASVINLVLTLAHYSN